MPVLTEMPHRHELRGDPSMQKPEKQKYDATYRVGKTTIHIVAPKDVTEEQKEQVLNELYFAAWSIVDELIEKGEKV